MTAGRVVILNGAPRSGKSSIARALMAEGPWINLGVDVQMSMLPETLKPGIGLRPGGERPDLEPHVQRLYAALFDAIAGYSRSGLDVVSDLGIHDDYSRPLGILPDAVGRLAERPVLFVGVHCPLEVIIDRRNAAPMGGLYATGETAVVPATRWQDAVHAHRVYDLEIDTSLTSAVQAAEMILTALDRPPTAHAFHRMVGGPTH